MVEFGGFEGGLGGAEVGHGSHLLEREREGDGNERDIERDS